MQFERPLKVICVLGMHRSGTSCLTGSLQNYGLELVDYSDWNPHNRRGNRENDQIVNFHEKLLEDNGGSWDNPPTKVVWQDKHYQQARQILAQYKDIPLWGFKDPRTLLTLEGWLKLVPDMLFIGIYRHPVAVASSLARRSGGKDAFNQGLSLWRQYNKRLLKAQKKLRFSLLSFDWDEDTFHQALEENCQTLGLKKVSNKRFFTSELVNNEGADIKLPWNIRRLFKKLKAVEYPLHTMILKPHFHISYTKHSDRALNTQFEGALQQSAYRLEIHQHDQSADFQQILLNIEASSKHPPNQSNWVFIAGHAPFLISPDCLSLAHSLSELEEAAIILVPAFKTTDSICTDQSIDEIFEACQPDIENPHGTQTFPIRLVNFFCRWNTLQQLASHGLSETLKTSTLFCLNSEYIINLNNHLTLGNWPEVPEDAVKTIELYGPVRLTSQLHIHATFPH